MKQHVNEKLYALYDELHDNFGCLHSGSTDRAVINPVCFSTNCPPFFETAAGE